MRPLYKGAGGKACPLNYRSIVVTPVLYRMIVQVVRERRQGWAEKKGGGTGIATDGFSKGIADRHHKHPTYNAGRRQHHTPPPQKIWPTCLSLPCALCTLNDLLTSLPLPASSLTPATVCAAFTTTAKAAAIALATTQAPRCSAACRHFALGRTPGFSLNAPLSLITASCGQHPLDCGHPATLPSVGTRWHTPPPELPSEQSQMWNANSSTPLPQTYTPPLPLQSA